MRIWILRDLHHQKPDSTELRHQQEDSQGYWQHLGTLVAQSQQHPDCLAKQNLADTLHSHAETNLLSAELCHPEGSGISADLVAVCGSEFERGNRARLACLPGVQTEKLARRRMQGVRQLNCLARVDESTQCHHWSKYHQGQHTRS